MNYNKIFLLDVEINNKELALLEAISKEQKEAGQREMAKKELDVFYRLRSYFHDKWNNKKIKTKEEYEQKRKEFTLLNHFVNLGLEEAKLNNKDVNSYLTNVLDTKPTAWKTVGGDNNSLNQEDGQLPYFKINAPKFSSEYTKDDMGFRTNTKEIRKNIRKFIVMHEYGHLYNFLKNVIETGKGYIVDTIEDDPIEVIDSEDKANAYAIDNMYRKDIRNLLKNSKTNKKDFAEAAERLKKIDNGYYLKDLYKVGTAIHSKKLKKYLDSIEKEYGNIKEDNYFDY